MEAEGKGALDKVKDHPLLVILTPAVQWQTQREFRAAILAHLRHAAAHLQPLFRYAREQILPAFAPGILRAVIEESRLLIFVKGLVV